jgi:hypothetical protein
MMCYKDRTFCDREDCKKFNKCGSAATKAISDGAERAEMPLSLASFEDCFEGKEKK